MKQLMRLRMLNVVMKPPRSLMLFACAATVGWLWLADATAARADEERSDARRARAEVSAGRFVPLERIIADALGRYEGKVVEVELDDDEYEIELLLEDGTKVELEYDARSGRLLEVDHDD